MATILDPLTDAKLIYAEDAHGSIGKRPAPDACVLSADFIMAMCADYGKKVAK